MAETSITALFTDRQGNLWIGPYYGDIRYGNIDLDDFKCFYSDEKLRIVCMELLSVLWLKIKKVICM